MFSASSLPSGAKFNEAPSQIGYLFDWTPNDTQSGDYRVIFLIEDGRGGVLIQKLLQ